MRVAIFGATGQVGSSLVGEFAGDEVLALSSSDCDIADYEAVMNTMFGFGPDVILNPAAMTAVDQCETDPDRAFATNALGPRNLALAASALDARLVHVSTDYVFDGQLGRAYDEWDEPAPLSVYGRSKRGGELEILRLRPAGTIVRTGVVFSRQAPNFALAILGAAEREGELQVVGDQIGSPTYAPQLAAALAAVARRAMPGVFHVAGTGACSRADLARELLAASGDDPERVCEVATETMHDKYPAPRPLYAALDGRAWRLAGFDPLPGWRDGVAALINDLAVAPDRAAVSGRKEREST